MTLKSPCPEAVAAAFAGANFGPIGETAAGRMHLVAECIVKRACGFHSGSTIESICKRLDLITEAGTPLLHAKRWAYCHLIHGHKEPTP